jgi:hypothetical protein
MVKKKQKEKEIYFGWSQILEPSYKTIELENIYECLNRHHTFMNITWPNILVFKDDLCLIEQAMGYILEEIQEYE